MNRLDTSLRSKSNSLTSLPALNILGNIIVMAFTASRVKQEIAKEGILPWSLFFATGHSTPDAWLREKWQAWHFRRRQNAGLSDPAWSDLPSKFREQSPVAALSLHWFSSVFLVAITSMMSPMTQYSVLIELYSYVMIVLMGFLVSAGLLYLRFGYKVWTTTREWKTNIKLWGGPAAAVCFCSSTLFLLITAFLRPGPSSPWSYSNSQIQWFIVPTIGLSTPIWGVVWWSGLKFVERKRGQRLKVNRRPYCEKDHEDGEWVLKYEIIDHEWHANVTDDEEAMRKSGRGAAEENESEEIDLEPVFSRAGDRNRNS